MLEFNAKKVFKVKAVDPDASYCVERTKGGSFAIASSKKELKQLMKSDATAVYDAKKGNALNIKITRSVSNIFMVFRSYQDRQITR